ncbi:LysR family transcriptional regulator [Acuticoccus sediminis]|uniref:LysR family transcriptional regulator n=1 Tax=Acuticoccus sediminis TaxID=2184697 RepID=A0A8B2NZU5_9HYPH|nr:LysR family transcriptional regulator [Acuticoccus sediminis]RAI04351.1 LysR family transcriptional regulator [Acuticoccus sediminis]
MDLSSALKAFVRTVERGSLTAAARDLNISQPAVTKQLGNLERQVGARLLERSARSVRLTPQGKALYEASREPLAALEAAIEGIRQDGGHVEGPLRVHAPSCIGVRHLHPIVMEFQRLHPDVTVDLVLENRDVDLVFDDFDLALRYERPAGQDVVIRRLGRVRRILVASPGFLERFGPIETPEQLGAIAVVTTSRLVAPRDVLLLEREGGEAVPVPVRPVLRTNNAEVIWSTLVSGHAAGPVQQLLVTEALADGRLVHILPGYEVRSTEAYLALPSVRYMRPAVRAFIEFAIPALRSVDGIVA